METYNRIIQLVKRSESVTFPVTPRGKIRTSSGDKYWKSKLKSSDPKKRRRAERVKAYYDYCEAIRMCALASRYELEDVIAVEFHLPMPSSWSGKKKERQDGQVHQVKPDADNMLKGLIDALAKNDSNIHFKLVWKVWTSGKGKIVIYKI